MDVAHDIRDHLMESGGVAGQCDLRQRPWSLTQLRLPRRTQIDVELHGGDFTIRIECVKVIYGILHHRGEINTLIHRDAAPLIQTGQ